MRLIYLHQYFITPEMSGGTRSYEMARRMVDQGHEVHMITSDRRGTGNRWHETMEDGIHVHWYPIQHSVSHSYQRRLRAFFKFAWMAARRAASIPGDLVFATSTPLTIALPGVFAARRQSIPMVFEVRDLWPEVPIAMKALRSRPMIAAAHRLERFAYANAAHVIALSPGMRDGVLAAGYPSESVTMIPNMCNPAHFGVDGRAGKAFRHRRQWLQDRPLVVYAGALGIANGVDYLARLAAVVRERDPEIRFLVVGSSREESRIRQVARQLGVLDRNFFMEPAVPKSEMPAILSATDIAASLFLDIKALCTTSPNKIFDALAAGKPIAVNSHQGWMAETIRETQCGLVLDPHDFKAGADELVPKVRNASWLRTAQLAAKKLADERFNRDRLVRLWESVMVNVVQQHKRNQLVLPISGRAINYKARSARRAA